MPNVWLAVPKEEGQWCEGSQTCEYIAVWQYGNRLGKYYCERHKNQEDKHEQSTSPDA